MVFIALWFLLNCCGIFSLSSCDSYINVLTMDWATCWCACCASLHPDCRIICLCLFLHVTMNLVTHCAPLLVATQHGASLVQPQVMLNCVHSSVGDEAYHCTPLHGSECTDRHGLSYTRDQFLCFQAAPLSPSLTSSMRELGIRDRFPRKRLSRGGRRKQKRITIICCGAARELVAKRWLEVVSCDPCPASPLPSPPPSQTPTASFFPGATLPSYMLPPPSSATSPPPCWFPGESLPSYIPPPPPSTTSPPPCWFPGAPLLSYIPPPPPSTMSPPPCSSPGATLPSYGPPPSMMSPPPYWFPSATLQSYGPPPSTTSPPPCWFPGATLPSYGHPPSTMSPPSCWFPGVTLQSYGPPPSMTSPPPCWFPGATLPSYGHPPSTTSPPLCSSPGVTLLSYGPPPLSAITSPLPFCFPVPLNKLATTRQAGVNSDNLVTLTVLHKATSHPTGNSCPAQNSLRLAYFNAQSCCQKASEINDLVVGGDFDILLMTETWLYASGDEAYITEMTPCGYLFHSFPRIGCRGGGIAIMFKSALCDSISMHPLLFNSFESVELRLLNDSTSVSVISLYRPPPSKQNKLSNKMFFEEFPTLVSKYSHARRDLTFIGDFKLSF